MIFMITLAGLALDVISKCAFSIDTDATKNPNDELLKHGNGVFTNFMPKTWPESIMFQAFTSYVPYILNFMSMLTESQRWMHKLTRNIMKVLLLGAITGNYFCT